MKLDKLFEDEIKRKLEPRKPIFITRVKLWIERQTEEWEENCKGLLIIYSFNGSHYFAIMNVMKFQINFDMEIYTNFLQYTKFIGQTKSMLFLVPLRQKIVKFLFVLQNKKELNQLKNALQSFLYQRQDQQELSYFQTPQIIEILQRAEINPRILEDNLTFRKETKEEIDGYFAEVEKLQKKKTNTGFKAYGFGREEWKLANEEIEFMKEKKKGELIDRLARLHRQARIT